MEAKEFMIGDWVLVTHAHTSPTIERVSGIGSNVVLIKKGSGYRSLDYIFIKPIPLTEEILKKNGFVVNAQQAYLIDGIFLDKGLDGNAYWWQIGHCPICAINYVHELQHALRLCGLNELADNFKMEI